MGRDESDKKPTPEDLLIEQEERTTRDLKERAVIEEYVDQDLLKRLASNETKGWRCPPALRDDQVAWHLALARGQVVPTTAGERKRRTTFRRWLGKKGSGVPATFILLRHPRVSRAALRAAARLTAGAASVVLPVAALGFVVSRALWPAHGEDERVVVAPDVVKVPDAAPLPEHVDSADGGEPVPTEITPLPVPRPANPGDAVRRLIGPRLRASKHLGDGLVLSMRSDGTATLESAEFRCRGAVRGLEFFFGCSMPSYVRSVLMDEFLYLTARAEADGRALVAEVWKPFDMNRSGFFSIGVIVLTPENGDPCTLPDSGVGGTADLALSTNAADIVARVCGGTESVFCRTFAWKSKTHDDVRWRHSEFFPPAVIRGCDESRE